MKAAGKAVARDPVELLKEVESRGATASGALVFGDEGMILIECGRICWVMASTQERKLGGILHSLSGGRVSEETFEEVFRACHTSGTPLGEGLVERGIIDAETLRAGLLQHIIAGVWALCQLESIPIAWLAQKFQKYDARFTFSPVEVLAGMGAVVSPELARAASANLEWHLEGGGIGFAFAPSLESAHPGTVAVFQGEGFGIQGVIELRNWAFDALDLIRAFSPNCRLATMSWRPGGSLLAWENGPTTFVAACDGPSSLASALARHVRRQDAP